MQDTNHRQRYTSPEESRGHKWMVVGGLILGVCALFLEFLLVKDPFHHGMWTAVALTGFGVAGVYSVILLKEKEYADDASSPS